MKLYKENAQKLFNQYQELSVEAKRFGIKPSFAKAKKGQQR